jgi:hypothetical protein
LGKLSFYLDALDRDVKKPHERPSKALLRRKLHELATQLAPYCEPW